MPEHEAIRGDGLDVSYYRVVEDRTLADGTKVHQCPISPKYATPEQAETALSELARTHPGARTCCITLFCGDAGARDAEIADIQ
ncbi:hypothetical protein [Vreelandella utahensis]|uniref:hypothetical protein n=1 Tax=Vreelandella halophila TaxID=86177 RepID=UPI000986B699|nr:hypothetical protein [Halomonas utahensis]